MVIETAPWNAFADAHGCVHMFVRALAWFVQWLAGLWIRFPILAW
jgi:hypothetical protein